MNWRGFSTWYTEICSSLMLDFEVRGWKIEEDKPHEMHS